ncbi:MAG: E3 binding domain-containing protein, partial [Anaerolineales bacterium]
MAEFVNMPKLGFDMAEGTLVRWVKKLDEPVSKGEVLAEIETDKATVEVEANAEGFVRKFLVEEGEAVPVGTPIAIVGQKDEPVEDLVPEAASSPETAAQADEPETKKTVPEPARQTVPEPAQTKAEGHLPDGVRASPLARRMADDHNLDLSRVSGSGPQGRVVKEDIERALESDLPAA